jgi:hypothetical protein
MIRLEVRLSRDYWIRQYIVGGITGFIALALIMLGLKHQPVLILVGLTPLGFWLGISVWNYRRGPAILDSDGITRRDGVRFAWKDLEELKRVNAVLQHGQPGGLNHLVLRFREGGVVTVFPLVIEDPYKMMGFAERMDRRRTCEICNELGEYQYGFQKRDYDTQIPKIAARLKTIKDVAPDKRPSMHIRQCPLCQRYYMYETDYGYYVDGAEEEQRLRRLTDEQAAGYLGH